ncbi:MAG: hypothetical protein HY685_05670 [Chloroflexi bacterium]|nr:hypothetical protein [Chloroflexota bacterium]
MNASLDRVLRSVIRPGRYAGGEWNGLSKPWDSVRLRVCLAYPDVYETGACHPGMASLYQSLNQQPDYLAERVYAPWPDVAAALRSSRLPLFSLESRRPLAEFEVLAFFLARGLTYTSFLTMLDLAGVPVHAAERSGRFPLVVGWGEGMLNPEPLADFLDIALAGDPEVLLPHLLAVYGESRTGQDRKEVLRALARLPGVYVPSLFVAEEAGGAPERTQRVLAASLPPVPTRPPVPYLSVAQDRGTLELQQGCDLSCPAFPYGFHVPPSRERTPEEALHGAMELLQSTGFEELVVTGDCLRHVRGLAETVGTIARHCRWTNTGLGISGLRLEDLSLSLVEELAQAERWTLSLGPVAADVGMAKKVETEAIPLLPVLAVAVERGLKTLRLTALLGHPATDSEEWEALPALVGGIRKAAGRNLHLRVRLVPFVPRPQTPLQWAPQVEPGLMNERLPGLKKALARLGAAVSWVDAQAAVIEGALARGDRRLGKVIYAAWASGCTLDTLSESFQAEGWHRAFASLGHSAADYTRARDPSQPLPWRHIDMGLSPERLWEAYQSLHDRKN